MNCIVSVTGEGIGIIGDNVIYGCISSRGLGIWGLRQRIRNR